MACTNNAKVEKKIKAKRLILKSLSEAYTFLSLALAVFRTLECFRHFGGITIVCTLDIQI